MDYTRISSLLLASALAGGASIVLAACGGGGDTPPDAGGDDGGADAGTQRDGGRDGGGGNVGSCASPRTYTLTAGTQTIDGDTTGGRSPLDLGDCGGDGAAPQDVLALTLPGTASETYGVRFDLAQPATADEFDTVVQVREDCGSAAGALCFDDSEGDYRSAGAFSAPGGSTRFLVVTGYAPPYDPANEIEGPWAASVEVVGPLAPPVFTGGTILNVDDAELRFTVTGSDVDMDAAAIAVQFLDASGAVVGIDADGDPGTPPVDEFLFGLDGATGMATFTATSNVDVAGVAELETITQARVAIVDEYDLRSATMDIAFTAATEVGAGETCDATHLCATGLECSTGSVCEIPAAVVAACAAATADFLVPTATETNSTVVTIPAGDGLLTGSCSDTSGGEALLEVTGAAGYDLVLDTGGTATADTDTVLYVMTTCGDPSTEVSCNDDRTEEMLDSHLEILNADAASYTVVVEVFGGVDAPTMVDVSGRLRPVLASGAACDPMGVTNRCAAGSCPPVATPTCP